MTATKPTILIVPGSFVEPELYSDVMSTYRARGYPIEAIALETAGKKPGPLPTMYDDANSINSAVSKLADEGKEVILVAHSYGGAPATQSLKGISKADRKRAGKAGGVIRIAYLTALVPKLGDTAALAIAGAPSGYNVPDEVSGL
jgi:alpha-beta hydrolase superfamily lysophospholipase